MELSLRNYQEVDVNKIRQQYSKGRTSLLYCLPTGGGKTFIFSYITQQARLKGNRVLVLVHRVELVQQTCDALETFKLKFGVINPQYDPDYSQEVQVASVQSLARRLIHFDKDFFDLIVIDEAHHATAGQWQKILDHFPAAKRLGVTATPERLDGKPLNTHFEELIKGPEMSWLQDEGHLAPCRVFAPPKNIDLSRISKRAGDYAADQVEEQTTTRAFCGDVVSHYKKHLKGDTAIAFCCTVRHAELTAAAFSEAGITAIALSGKTSPDKRKKILWLLGQKHISVVCSCQVISEGTDIPSVGGCLLLRPTLSLSVYLQQVGRCLRPSNGKTAIILDHVGNVEKHGLPTDPRDWSIEGRKKRNRTNEQDVPVKVCPKCFAAVSSALQYCDCGYKFEPKDEPHHIVINAELLEVKRAKKKKRSEVGRARTLAELEMIADRRGYNRKWAYHVLKSREGRSQRYGRQ